MRKYTERQMKFIKHVSSQRGLPYESVLNAEYGTKEMICLQQALGLESGEFLVRKNDGVVACSLCYGNCGQCGNTEVLGNIDFKLSYLASRLGDGKRHVNLLPEELPLWERLKTLRFILWVTAVIFFPLIVMMILSIGYNVHVFVSASIGLVILYILYMLSTVKGVE